MMNSLDTKNFTYFLIVLACAFVTLTQNTSYAATFYVSTNGNDSNPGTEASSFRTIKHGIGSLSAGDTLFVKSGDYYESILSWKTPIPHGTSWNNPVTIAAFPGHTVTIKPPAGHAAFWIKDPTVKYLIIDGFIMDGQGKALHGIKLTENATHVRVQNSEIRNSQYSGILVTVCSGCTDPHTAPHDTYHEFINLNVHHNGSSIKDHGFYVATSHNLIEYCDIHHNSSNGGKFYSGYFDPGTGASSAVNNNIIRYTTLHDNSQNSSYPNDPTTIVPAAGWILSSGDGNIAYGNIAYNQPRGIVIGHGAKNALMYNNIVYNNEIGIWVHGAWGGSTDAKVFNNTVYNNSQYGINVRDNAKNTTIKNNIAFKNGSNTSSNIWLQTGGSPGTVTSSNFLADPEFIGASANNFRLKPGSPAIDAGLTIPEVPIDLYGVKRAQGRAYDIGAIEEKEDTAPPAQPQAITIS